MNGELGVLAHHDSAARRVIARGRRRRRLALDSTSSGTLRLAYAISVHKSQGSQAPGRRPRLRAATG